MEICWQNSLNIFQTVCKSSHRSCSNKEAVLKSFLILTRKQLCWSLFFKKAWDLRPEKKRLQHRCFPANIVKFSITSISNLRMAVSWYILQNAFRTYSCFIILLSLYYIIIPVWIYTWTYYTCPNSFYSNSKMESPEKFAKMFKVNNNSLEQQNDVVLVFFNFEKI